MNPAQTSTPFILRITNHLPLIEKVLLTALAIGTVLAVMQIDSAVIRISLIGLAVTFFLFAYRPIEVPKQKNEPFGFSELLAFMIVPKGLWISSAISALGIEFYLSDFNNEGYKQMLIIGGLSIGIGALLIVVFLVSGIKHLKTVTPILLRAVPLLLMDLYILFK